MLAGTGWVSGEFSNVEDSADCLLLHHFDVVTEGWRRVECDAQVFDGLDSPERSIGEGEIGWCDIWSGSEHDSLVFVEIDFEAITQEEPVEPVEVGLEYVL